MNLQPIPGTLAHPFAFVCVDCGRERDARGAFADLDGRPGAYICARFACLYHMTGNKARDVSIRAELDELHQRSATRGHPNR